MYSKTNKALLSEFFPLHYKIATEHGVKILRDSYRGKDQLDIKSFIKKEAKKFNRSIFDEIEGEIKIGHDCEYTQSSGAVYGLFVEFNNEELKQFIKELPKKLQQESYKPIQECWYALYWGKDLTPGARVKAHVQGHRNNGNARLKNYKTLKGKKIKYAAVYVEQYEKFEMELHEKYQPLLGTRRRGSASKIVRVLK